jgi:ribonuclease P protein component
MTSLELHKNGAGNKFPAKERVKSQKIAEELFSKGSSHYLYPYRLLSLNDPLFKGNMPQVLISVPKRIFKKAVDRNRIKRQIREAYRLNKRKIFASFEKDKMPAYLGIIYTAKEKLDYKILEEKLILILERLKK